MGYRNSRGTVAAEVTETVGSSEVSKKQKALKQQKMRKLQRLQELQKRKELQKQSRWRRSFFYNFCWP